MSCPCPASPRTQNAPPASLLAALELAQLPRGHTVATAGGWRRGRVRRVRGPPRWHAGEVRRDDMLEEGRCAITSCALVRAAG
jgi:hypothetical protein